MSQKIYAKTLVPWLKANGFVNFGGLTGQDWPALLASVMVADLWLSCDGNRKQATAAAFRLVVESMQPEFRHLAFHGIAHAGDWGHRDQLWAMAELEPLAYRGRAKYE